MIRDIAIGLIAGAIAVLALCLANPTPTRVAWEPPKVFRLGDEPPPPALLTTRPSLLAKVLPEVRFADVDGREAIRALSDLSGVPIVMRPGWWTEPVAKVNVQLRNVTLSAALHAVLFESGQKSLDCVEREGVVWIVDDADAYGWFPTRGYNVRDIIAAGVKLDAAPCATSADAGAAAAASGAPSSEERTAATLIKAIVESCAPNGRGEGGTIHYISGCLIIDAQNAGTHERIERFLSALRAAMKCEP